MRLAVSQAVTRWSFTAKARPEFNPKSVRVEFVVDKVAPEQLF
jgi:hypothetical protein